MFLREEEKKNENTLHKRSKTSEIRKMKCKNAVDIFVSLIYHLNMDFFIFPIRKLFFDDPRNMKSWMFREIVRIDRKGKYRRVS